MDISQKIHLLGDLLGKVISEIEAPDLFEKEEHIRSLARERRNGDEQAARNLQQSISTLSIKDARVLAASFAAYFDLVNLVEEDHRVQILRQRESEVFPESNNESIGEAFAILKEQGVTPGQIKTLMENLSIELVLTAHPTEARRRTIFPKQNALPHCLPNSVKTRIIRVNGKPPSTRFGLSFLRFGLPTGCAPKN